MTQEEKRIVPKWLRITIRVILLPVALIIFIIPHIIGLIVTMCRWIKYGGEMIVYLQDDVPMISRIFYELKEQKK